MCLLDHRLWDSWTSGLPSEDYISMCLFTDPYMLLSFRSPSSIASRDSSPSNVSYQIIVKSKDRAHLLGSESSHPWYVNGLSILTHWFQLCILLFIIPWIPQHIQVYRILSFQTMVSCLHQIAWSLLNVTHSCRLWSFDLGYEYPWPKFSHHINKDSLLWVFNQDNGHQIYEIYHIYMTKIVAIYSGFTISHAIDSHIWIQTRQFITAQTMAKIIDNFLRT